jgi:hypothetical protein
MKTYRILVGKPLGKLPHGRLRRIWEDNIKMDFREVDCEARKWIEAPNYIQLKVLLLVVSNPQVILPEC